MAKWNARTCLPAVALALMLVVGTDALVYAEKGDWGFGTDVGFISGTTNNTVFALNFQADYYLTREFSVGPMFQWVPAGDLKQYAFAGAARYHYQVNNKFNIVPFAGVGFIHADLDKGAGSARINRNDTSSYIPLGVSFEYQVSPKLAFSNTVMLNMHDINMSPSLQRDTTSVSVLFGMRFNP
ncbi:MAG: outer membrane beta-barrel protein [Nitrospira sp.]